MEQLTTERLILREWRLSDSTDLFEYAQSEQVGPNAGWPPHESEETSKEIIKSFIEMDCVYAIVLAEENKVIGGIGLHERQPNPNLTDINQREIGYVLNPAYWGRGIVPESVRHILAYGFNQMNSDLIWCGHYSDNLKSKRVIEKCGFTYEFTKEEVLKLLDNKKVKTLYYSIRKEDYNESN